MDSDRFLRLKGLFLAALDMSAAEQEDYLSRECGTDTNLRRDVESLLSQPSRNFDVFRDLGIMASLGEMVSASTADSPPLPDHIGPYRILGLIGEGGMGSVYHALQTDPIRREVALKSIRAGLDSPSLRARLESERQILAVMDHPNIARVLDAGSDDHGHPYFVMELVRGEPITRYAADHNLSVTDRLGLFRKVCRAVQDAHAKGIIHRDLKPSNILVTLHGDVPDVKIIDFGIAKATEEVMVELLTETPTTQDGRIIGTLDYMSPEQTAGGPGRVDVRGDVYALGVILYELLANALPYRVQGLPLPEALRIIATESPPTIRRSPTGHGRLPDDLNVIAGKAMEKDPARRYDTAAQLADDVDRFLRSEPIFARSPSAVYQVRKLVGRHKAASLLAVILVALTVGYAVSASVLLETQRRERQRAEQEALERDEISRFLVDMFGADGSSVLPPDQVTARDLLERAAAHIETGGDLPQSQARLLGAVGEAMSKLGLRDRAVEVLRESLDRSRELFGPRSLEAAQASLNLGEALTDARRFEEAAPYLEEGSRLLDEYQSQDSEATLRALLDLANTHRGLGNLDRAEQETLDLIETLKQHPQQGSVMLIKSEAILALIYRGQERNEEAERVYREILPTARAEKHLPTLVLGELLNNYGYLLMREDRLEEAVPLYREALDRDTEQLGERHPDRLLVLTNLAALLDRLQRFDEAETLLAERVRIDEAIYPKNHWRVGAAYGALGGLLMGAGKPSRALTMFQKRVNIYRASLGDDHPWTACAEATLAASFLVSHDPAAHDGIVKHCDAVLSRTSRPWDGSVRAGLRAVVRYYKQYGLPQPADHYLTMLAADSTRAAQAASP